MTVFAETFLSNWKDFCVYGFFDEKAKSFHFFPSFVRKSDGELRWVGGGGGGGGGGKRERKKPWQLHSLHDFHSLY